MKKVTNKKLKEKIYSKLYDSVGFLVTNQSILPKSICKVDLRLNKKELAKLTNIHWFISHTRFRSYLDD